MPVIQMLVDFRGFYNELSGAAVAVCSSPVPCILDGFSAAIMRGERWLPYGVHDSRLGDCALGRIAGVDHQMPLGRGVAPSKMEIHKPADQRQRAH